MSQMQTATVTAGAISITGPADKIMRGVLAELTGAANDTAAKRSATPRIGEHWPEHGGVLAGIMRGENGNHDYYLIVPTASEASAKIAWGSYGKEEPGASSDRDGLKNTAALVASEHEHPAAAWAAGLAIGQHSDLYLPARHELRLCYLTVPELFEKEWHWSSTQFSANYAYVQLFSGGVQNGGHKGGDYLVRAVRRVLIIQ